VASPSGKISLNPLSAPVSLAPPLSAVARPPSADQGPVAVVWTSSPAQLLDPLFGGWTIRVGRGRSRCAYEWGH